MREPTEKEIRDLAGKALAMRSLSYIPYSGFAVGAALLCDDGSTYEGCNIENASFGAANCAERTAIFKAVSEGKRDFSAIAVAGGYRGKDPDDFCPPCAICLQVMSEFCTPDFRVFLVKSAQEIISYTLNDLLPVRFHNLKET